MVGTTVNVTKSTKQLAQDAVKRIAAEPWEILKEAKRQTVEESQSNQPSELQPEAKVNETVRIQQKDKQLSSRQMEALNRELADIGRDKLLKQLQEKIASGEIVYLEQYPQLSVEQKQVLQAQIEAMKARQDQQLASQKSLVEPGFKKGRRLFGFGQKTAVERQKTHVERPLPPSG